MKQATEKQIDFLESLQERLGWSDATVAEEAREQGIIVDIIKGSGPAYAELSIGDASELIEVMKSAVEQG